MLHTWSFLEQNSVLSTYAEWKFKRTQVKYKRWNNTSFSLSVSKTVWLISKAWLWTINAEKTECLMIYFMLIIIWIIIEWKTEICRNNRSIVTVFWYDITKTIIVPRHIHCCPWIRFSNVMVRYRKHISARLHVFIKPLVFSNRHSMILYGSLERLCDFSRWRDCIFYNIECIPPFLL